MSMTEKSVIDRFNTYHVLGQRSSCQLFYRPFFLHCGLMGEKTLFELYARTFFGCSTSSGHWGFKNVNVWCENLPPSCVLPSLRSTQTHISPFCT